MLHEIDFDLLCNAKQILRYLKKNHPKDLRKNELQNLIQKYEIACSLACGKDPGRSKYWSREAIYINSKLRILELKLYELYDGGCTGE